MKSWIPIPDASTEWRRWILHKVGGCAARLLLFASVFLIHPGERCANDIGSLPVRPADVSRETAPQPVAEAPSVSNDVQLNF